MADGTEPRPLESGSATQPRYIAFISYNKRDVRFVRRLHRELETYRLPRQLSNLRGPSRRLQPIFRDGDELTAAYDLTTAVREAIAQSDSLIVVCSPNSAQSEWVGREIELFRALHGDRRIFAAIIDGTPETAFHPALRGASDGAALQPLAADFRREGGGRRVALLKLVGALTGVGLDDLIHRDAQRRMRQTMAGTAFGAATGITVLALGGLALRAQADAERRRTETTGLVEYMLTDLRKSMQRTGRLDQLAALNDGAMQYYRHQDLKRLSEAQLRQRAKLLQAMGEDDEKRGKLQAARESFEDAHRTTAALLAAKPNDPKRIFAHAQSEYWVGFINWRNGDGVAARKGFEAYAALANRLVQIDPGNRDWQHEVAYAEGNLGTLAMRQAGNFQAAEQHFRKALTQIQAIAERTPTDASLKIEVATCLAWLADSERLGGKYASALDHRLAQRRILTRLRTSDPQNREVRADLLSNDLALARIDADRGNTAAAIRTLNQVRAEAVALLKADPDNLLFAKQARMSELFRVRTILNARRAPMMDLPLLDRTLGDCASSAEADSEIGTLCLALKARIAASRGDQPTATKALGALYSYRETAALSPRWGLDLNHEIALARNSGSRSR